MDAALKHMTPDEFLVWSLDQPDKWELVDGVPRMMTGATRLHDAIVVNVISELKLRLRGKPCRPNTADVATRVPNGSVRRPDVTVDCGGDPDTSVVSDRPTVFVEVLSKSTRAIDMVRKAEEYKSIPSVLHVVLIEPDLRRAWIWSRTDATTVWTHQEVEGAEGVINLPGIDVALPFSAIYDGVAIE